MIEQGTPEWFEARLGKITASRIKDVMDRTAKGLPSAKRTSYMKALMAERLTGKMVENYVNSAMEHGINTEPVAVMAYEAETANFVEQASFYAHPVHDFLGASPDRLVGDDGLLEVKCPTTQTHLENITIGMYQDHKHQVQCQLWVTGRQWLDLISFDNRITDKRLHLHIQRIYRDESFIAQMENAVLDFEDELREMIAAVYRAKGIEMLPAVRDEFDPYGDFSDCDGAAMASIEEREPTQEECLDYVQRCVPEPDPEPAKPRKPRFVLPPPDATDE